MLCTASASVKTCGTITSIVLIRTRCLAKYKQEEWKCSFQPSWQSKRPWVSFVVDFWSSPTAATTYTYMYMPGWRLEENTIVDRWLQYPLFSIFCQFILLYKSMNVKCIFLMTQLLVYMYFDFFPNTFFPKFELPNLGCSLHVFAGVYSIMICYGTLFSNILKRPLNLKC